MVDTMRVDFPGLLIEPLPSGGERLRVRVEGNKAKRITLNVKLNHPAFNEHYRAARTGIQLPPPDDGPIGVRGSIGWLVELFQKHMERQVEAGQLDQKTQSYRIRHTNILRAEYGEYAVDMPTEKLQSLVDGMMDRPGAANTFIKSVRAMYKWGRSRGYARKDPTKDVQKLQTEEKGATPWTVADLNKYRQRHPFGTMAHLYLTLLIFTACRIEDALYMGRGNEFKNNGVLWLRWEPRKRGSQKVEIPMAPQVIEATRAQKVQGTTYILNAWGKPFASEGALGNRFRKWCDQADLKGLSSHGVRKAAGSLLAEAGMSQHVIMAIHGHSEARTSEIYTKGAQRRLLAEQGMSALGGLKW